jgi:CNT family concentrative nucleoside transporter
MMAIPACFVLSKILVPETEKPLTAGSLPNAFFAAQLDPAAQEERLSPMDAVITGAMEGLRMAASIAAVLIAVLGLVFLVNQFFVSLADLADSDNSLLQPIGQVFQWINLQNILGVLFFPLTLLTGISLDMREIWEASVLIGQRLLQTEIPSYQQLALASALPADSRILSDRALLIVSYALSGFAHFASVGIFVGGISALAPTRRKEIASLSWKALFAGTLATYMIACMAGLFDTGNPSILGRPTQQSDTPALTAPASPSPANPSPTSPSPTSSASPTVSP